MDIRNILFRKEMKLVTLLLTSLLVASASAFVYYAMLAQSTATVDVAAVHFIAGDDSSGVFTPGANDTYAELSLKAYPNVTLTYDQAVNLTATAAKDVQLRHVSIDPDDGDPSVSNFTSVVFTLIDGTGGVKGTLTYTSSGDDWTEPASATGYQQITNGEKWTIKIEIKAAAEANTGVWTRIVIAVDVR
jgi:hypothetical protein